jgi:aspartokinase
VYEIYRELRKGRRVLAVVSAFKGATDWLLHTRQFEAPQADALAGLVATGETASAAYLGMALHEAGVTASVADAHRVGLEIRGSELDGRPVDIDTSRVHTLFERYSVLILPGFIGRTSNVC